MPAPLSLHNTKQHRCKESCLFWKLHIEKNRNLDVVPRAELQGHRAYGTMCLVDPRPQSGGICVTVKPTYLWKEDVMNVLESKPLKFAKKCFQVHTLVNQLRALKLPHRSLLKQSAISVSWEPASWELCNFVILSFDPFPCQSTYLHCTVWTQISRSTAFCIQLQWCELQTVTNDTRIVHFQGNRILAGSCQASI